LRSVGGKEGNYTSAKVCSNNEENTGVGEMAEEVKCPRCGWTEIMELPTWRFTRLICVRCGYQWTQPKPE